MDTRLTKVEQLTPGMVVAEDVFDEEGHLIVSHELVISERLIMRLRLFSISSIKVYIQPEAESPVNSRPRYTSNKVTNSMEFQKFKKDYSENVEEFKDVINGIVYGDKEIEKENLINSVNKMFDAVEQKSQIFNMIRNMKQFDDTIYRHSYNVAIICKMFGIWLKKPQQEIDNLTLAALLHDIGKIKIPSEILNKTSELTPNERKIVQCHAKWGYEILKSKNIDEEICQVALQHHERRNGSGYPNGLRGHQINEMTQIVSIADIYDAMTARRTYRLPHSPFRVLEYFQKEGYDLFEARFLIPFMEKTESSCLYKSVTLNNGVEGEVVMLNSVNKSRPLIKTQYGFIDLSQEKDLEIEDVL